MSRLIWLGTGIGVGVYSTRRVQRLGHQVGQQLEATNAGRIAVDTYGRMSSLVSAAREVIAEREAGRRTAGEPAANAPQPGSSGGPASALTTVDAHPPGDPGPGMANAEWVLVPVPTPTTSATRRQSIRLRYRTQAARVSRPVTARVKRTGV